MQALLQPRPAAHPQAVGPPPRIDKLRGQLDQKGLALIPLNIHLKGSWIKLTIGLGKGRKLHDKRAAEKDKQSKKEVKAAIARF